MEKENMTETVKVKGKIGNQEIEFEYPKDAFGRTDEKPHIHKSKPHPSANNKQCDICGKMMVKHYHVCEDCFKYMRESLILKIRELEAKVKELEKK
jgi:hypothetical protein